jgi:hypothetical protein
MMFKIPPHYNNNNNKTSLFKILSHELIMNGHCFDINCVLVSISFSDNFINFFGIKF